jgi:CheY-like chemotaxis protein
MNPRFNHVCFADDDADDHLVFATALNETFPAVALYPFYNCTELLAFLNDENRPLPDMIFLDLNMPGNEKNECLLTIKQTLRLKDIPVVIYSTSNYNKDVELALSNGAYKYITKPASFGEVKELINRLISSYGSTDN